MAETERPDGILLDFLLPDGDAPTVMTRLRASESTAKISVILMTAAPSGLQHVMDSWSIAGVIAKPFSPKELANNIDALLHWQ